MIRGLAVGWTLIVVLTAGFAPRPVTDNSVVALMGSDAPRVTAYERFLDRFGSDEIIVARFSGGTPFDRFDLVNTLTATLSADPSVDSILSVTSLHPETTVVILDEVFGGPDELRSRRSELTSPLAQRLGLWTAKSADHEGGANVYGLAAVSPPQVRARLAARLEILKERATARGVRLFVFGPPLLNLALDQAGRQTERTALPLLLFVAIVALLASTGSIRSTVALLLPIGLTVLAADGVFALLGGKTNLLVNIAKPLQFVIGLASAVHIYFEARRLVSDGVPRSEAAWQAARNKALPVAMALVTTAIGFGSLNASTVAPIRSFGLVAGLGLLMMILAVLLSIPLALGLVGRPKPARPTRSRWAIWSDRTAVAAAERMVELSLVHRWIGPAVGSGLTIAGLVALAYLKPEPHAIRYFAPEHPLRVDQAALEEAGLGVATVEVIFSRPGITRDSEVIPKLLQFTEAGSRDPAVATAVGWPHLAVEVQQAGRRPDIDAWVLERLSTLPAARTFSHDDQVRIAFVVRTVDATELDRLKSTLKTTARDLFSEDLRIEITGNYDLLLHAQAALLDTIYVSLLWTALLMELALILVLRSVWIGLVALVPNLFPVAVNLLVMAALGIPLDLGTSMTAAVALGIAVDDTLHFTFAAQGTSLRSAARSAGSAIVLSSAVIGIGFASLLTADFIPTQRFGGLCALAMLSALVADLFVYPPLLAYVRDRRVY